MGYLCRQCAGENSFTLVETLKDAVNESGQTQSDTHYAYAAELEKALEEGLTPDPPTTRHHELC